MTTTHTPQSREAAIPTVRFIVSGKDSSQECRATGVVSNFSVFQGLGGEVVVFSVAFGINLFGR